MDIAALTETTQTPQTNGAFSQLTSDFDTFLTLLTTQLQNQDPLEPLDTEQFTSQLVQFAGVEQSIQANSNLETLISLQSGANKQASLDLVGRAVSVAGGDFILGDNNQQSTTLRYTLPANASNLTLDIVDDAGRVVASLEGPTSGGQHDLVWNGQLANGAQAPGGLYRLQANATLADGSEIIPTIESRGRIDSLLLSGQSPQLIINGRQVALDDITRVDASF